VLGTEADVHTPDGTVRLKLAPGTQPRQKLRLKGRGLPAGGGARGDFFVQVDVTLPKSLTPEQRAQWEELAKAHSGAA